jgi:intracellular sulfur oxidation DsrE/DsrF family protein
VQVAAGNIRTTQLMAIAQNEAGEVTTMIGFGGTAGVLAAAIAALLMIALPSAGAGQLSQSAAPYSKRPIASKKPNSLALQLPSPAAKKSQAAAQLSKRLAANRTEHRLALQVNTNEPAMMSLALNNASNVAQYYKDLGEKVTIEIVAFGPGLHMLREDTSPVKARIASMALSTPSISFKACGNTRENMSKAEDKQVPLIGEASVVKSGVVRLMELQEQGWTYIKP